MEAFLRENQRKTRTRFFRGQLWLINSFLKAARDFPLTKEEYLRMNGELRGEVEKLAEQLRLRFEKGVSIPPELVEKARIITHRLRLRFENP